MKKKEWSKAPLRVKPKEEKRIMFEIAGGILVANVLEIVAGLVFLIIFVPVCFAIGYTKQKRKEVEQRERFIKYKERMDKGEKLTQMEQLDWNLFHDRYID